MSIPDAAKLARYDDLAELVEELHDENMRMKAEIQRLNELLAAEQDSNIELEGELARMCKHNRIDRIEFRDGSAEEIYRDCGRHWKLGAGRTATELHNGGSEGRAADRRSVRVEAIVRHGEEKTWIGKPTSVLWRKRG